MLGCYGWGVARLWDDPKYGRMFAIFPAKSLSTVPLLPHRLITQCVKV